MLSYGASKELEKLGYSQELKDGDWFYWLDAPDDPPFLYFSVHLKVVSDYVKVPTTDGMIGGLGEQFRELERDEYGNFRAWSANPRKWTEWRLKNGMERALCELWKEMKED